MYKVNKVFNLKFEVRCKIKQIQIARVFIFVRMFN